MPPTPPQLKANLIARARDLGAAALGIAEARRDKPTETRLRESLSRGDLASWAYDAAWSEQAADPLRHLARARSVISVAVAYGRPAHDLPLGYGRVSTYVWDGEDYHTRVRALLDALAAVLKEAGAADTLVLCDTRPFAERAAAVRAGLGWVGKHTNLIVPGTGSYVFLGEILTSLALPPDEPRKTHCGGCRRCVDVCPTGALRGDYTMDPRRCISDLTQLRGSIPRALRPLLGTWIWGCDLCQEVCPPTRNAGFPARAADPVFEAGIDLRELLTLDGPTFRKRYAATAMGWRGAAVLRRNAAVGLGNVRDRADVALLALRLGADPSAMVREHIAWALGRIASPQARAALLRYAPGEADPAVRAEIRTSLDPVANLGAGSEF